MHQLKASCFCMTNPQHRTRCRLPARRVCLKTRPEVCMSASASDVVHLGAHVRVEALTRDPRVVTIVLDRQERRNAVDRQLANSLRAAFELFDADTSRSVAILWGANGTFCACADLNALSNDTQRNEIHPDGDGLGPMGVPSIFRSASPSSQRFRIYGSKRPGTHPLVRSARHGEEPFSACFADAWACRLSTAARFACRGSSACRARWI